MLRELKNTGAASIVEVIVTSIVFVVAAAGILSTVAMFRPQGTEASKKIEAAYIGKGILDDLRQQINAENWSDTVADGYPLEPGQTYTVTIGNYNVIYDVSEPTSEYRYVNMTITFPDI